jgi:hypothetical protein
MIVDKYGNEVQLISCVKYTNVVKVKRVVDGEESEVSILDLNSTYGRGDLVENIRKIQTKP